MTLENASINLGGKTIFNNITLPIYKKDKICIVGRNGSGKSTLMSAISGNIELDSGNRILNTSIVFGEMHQKTLVDEQLSVFDYILSAQKEGELNIYKVEKVLSEMNLSGDKKFFSLSGGESRKASLCRAIVLEPDLLLLDEPTNHLDLPTIQWLEEFLENFSGAVLMISHDRRILEVVSKKIVWIDRGILRIRKINYSDFQGWKDATDKIEEYNIKKINKKVISEEEWLRKGVTARRKRNQGRLQKLEEIRRLKKSFLSQELQLSMNIYKGNLKSKLLINVENIEKSYGDKKVIKSFSTRIIKGDRIAIVGANGSGKSTLLGLLSGQIKQDEGIIKLNNKVSIAYFDQQKSSYDLNKTIIQTFCPNGGDQVMVRGNQRHITGYLKGFSFGYDHLNSKINSFSGGEQNRIFLALMFTNEVDLLVLDEPTNDLDLETLDLIESLISDYKGTLLMVSHDRNFIDNVANSIILIDSEGNLSEHVGGFTDNLQTKISFSFKKNKIVKKNSKGAKKQKHERKEKFSYNQEKELVNLSKKIEMLNEEISLAELDLSSPDLIKDSMERYVEKTKLLKTFKSDLKLSEDRWLELATIKENLSKKM